MTAAEGTTVAVTGVAAAEGTTGVVTVAAAEGVTVVAAVEGDDDSRQREGFSSMIGRTGRGRFTGE